MYPSKIIPGNHLSAYRRSAALRVTLPVLAAVICLGCGRELMDTTPRVRHMKMDGAADFHQPIRLTVGWMPYEEDRLVSKDGSTYEVAQGEHLKSGKIPALILSYEDGTKATLDMTIDDELLGKLIKSSLMSEKPIRRPYSEFMQTADCSTCHPSDIRIR